MAMVTVTAREDLPKNNRWCQNSDGAVRTFFFCGAERKEQVNGRSKRRGGEGTDRSQHGRGEGERRNLLVLLLWSFPLRLGRTWTEQPKS